MQFRIQSRRALMITYILGGLLTATAGAMHSTASANEVAAVPASTQPAVTSTPPTTPVSTDGAVRIALDYLQSNNRSNRFETQVPKAGIRIAKALESGRFGSTKRYDNMKINLTPDYIGWGGISSLDDAQFAWVYWNKGKIDYSKPITQISVSRTPGDTASGVVVFAPTLDNKADELGSYWSFVLSQPDGLIWLTDTYGIKHPLLAPTEHYHCPTSLDELIKLDRDGWQRFNDNMDAMYPDWNS